MARESYRFEELSPGAHSDQLLRLWRESSSAGGLMWQDRSPDPIKLYEGWGDLPTRLFGAWSGEELVASSVLVPHFPLNGSNGEELRLIYDTDLVVRPDHRQSGALLGLLDFRHEKVFSDMSEKSRESSIFFGLSHRPGLGKIILERFRRKTKDWGCGLNQTVLSEFSCQQEFSANPTSSLVVDQNVGLPKHSPDYIIPIGAWREQHLSALKRATESFYQFRDLKFGYSGFLCDFRLARKMRWNQRAERLLSQVSENDEVRYLIATFTEGRFFEDSEELQATVRDLLLFAKQRDYAFLAVRDLPEATLESLRAQGFRMTTFSRDMFVWGYEASRQKGLEFVERLVSKRSKVEGLFL